MFCKHCGASLADDAKFCANCGNSVEADATTQPAPATTQDAPATTQAAPAPTGMKLTLLLIAAVSAFVSILLSFGLFFAGGITLSGYSYLQVTDFFDYSEMGVIRMIFDAISNGGFDGVLSLLFSFIIVYVTLILLLVELIKGIIAMIAAVKGKNYSKVLKPAVGAFGAHAEGMLLFYSFNAASMGKASVQLNGATTAGLSIAAILIGAYLVLHAVLNGKNSFKLSFLLKVAYAAGGVVLGGIIAGLASGPVVVINGVGQSYLGMLVDTLVTGALSSNTSIFIYSGLGFVATISLISIGLEFIKRAMFTVGAATDNEEPQKSLLGASITSLVMSILLMIASFLYADSIRGDLDPAVPVVMVVFSVLGVVMYALQGKLVAFIAQKEAEKESAKAASRATTQTANEEVAQTSTETASEEPAAATTETASEEPAQEATETQTASEEPAQEATETQTASEEPVQEQNNDVNE